MSDPELEQVFQQGVAAIRAGDKAKARELLTQVVEANQLHEQAWLWLSAAVTDKEEQILCLENVLTINPNNEIALRGVRKLGGKAPESAPEPPPEPKPEAPLAKTKDESWRDKIKDSDYVSEATIVKPMHERPNLGIADLANAWVWAAIFQIPGSYQDEVDYGPVTHVAVSVFMSLLFRGLGLGLLVGLTINNPARLKAIEALLTPRNRAAFEQMIHPSGAAAVSMGTIILITFVGMAIFSLISLFFQAIVYNKVAEMMNGKGEMMATAQALGIAMVPSALLSLPIYLLSAFITGPGNILSLISFIYDFIQTANAVNASHRIGIFASMGVVIIGFVAMVGLTCCLIFGTSLIFGR